MRTETENKTLDRLLEDKNLKGRWKLTYKLVNSQGLKAFGGIALSSYNDPLTGKSRHLLNMDGKPLSHLMIDKVVTIFEPEKNPEHRNILDFLIGHPKVGLQNKQTDLDYAYLEKKISNPRFQLVNLDHIETEELEDEDFIDKLVGRIVLDSGKNALSTEVLQFVLCHLNKPYRDARFMNNKEKLKIFLRKSLKDYVRKSKENAQEVIELLDNIGKAQYSYEIKEAIRLNILNRSNGMIKYRNVPIGISIDAVIKYFSENTEVYTEITKELYTRLKLENN